MVGALKPASYDDIRGVWDPKEDKDGVDIDDQSFLTLSNSRGWRNLRKHIDSLKDGLDKRLSQSVLNSLSDDQIKKDALFAVLGKDLLNSIIDKVEGTALAVEDIKNGRSKD